VRPVARASTTQRGTRAWGLILGSAAKGRDGADAARWECRKSRSHPFVDVIAGAADRFMIHCAPAGARRGCRLAKGRYLGRSRPSRTIAPLANLGKGDGTIFHSEHGKWDRDEARARKLRRHHRRKHEQQIVYLARRRVRSGMAGINGKLTSEVRAAALLYGARLSLTGTE